MKTEILSKTYWPWTARAVRIARKLRSHIPESWCREWESREKNNGVALTVADVKISYGWLRSDGSHVLPDGKVCECHKIRALELKERRGEIDGSQNKKARSVLNFALEV